MKTVLCRLCNKQTYTKKNYQDLWRISANVNNISEFFITHSFTNSSLAAFLPILPLLCARLGGLNDRIRGNHIKESTFLCYITTIQEYVTKIPITLLLVTAHIGLKKTEQKK